MDNIIPILFGVAIIFFGLRFILKTKSNIKDYKKEYDEALRGSDRLKTLEAGRKYYKALRMGQGPIQAGLRWSVDDEQAIANDMAAMEKK